MNPLESLRVGQQGTATVVVRPDLTVRHHLPTMPAVYATPMMIFLMEVAAANAIHPLLPQGYYRYGASYKLGVSYRF